ncbi:hypothetical protein BDQ17DRAFT_1341023 [Cyathus striatus]|nr:hypothetical protein BDQ17DRAFT_1341023 [Cyathus striatus]
MAEIESGSSITIHQYPFVPRRIRHITSIQIRNLTPFPVRDSFTSALSKPIEISQLNSGGQIPYVDVASPKKRLRKLSSDSAPQANRRDRIHDDELTLHLSGRRVRPRSHSSQSRMVIADRPSSSSDDLDSSYNSFTSKYMARPRTTSMISLVPSRLSELSKEMSSLSALLLDTSQGSLESVISSRLVETFLSIDILPSSNRTVTSRHREVLVTETIREPTKRLVSLGRHGRRPHNAPKSSSGHLEDDIPDYLSPIHIPSTNPIFPIDVRSGRDISPWIDINGRTLDIKLWGRRPSLGDASTLRPRAAEHRKGLNRTDAGWVVLGCWDVDLDELRELPENCSDYSDLPSNSLVITLSPPGKTFYYPESGSTAFHSALHNNGYTSDPEFRSQAVVREFAASSLISTSQYSTREQDIIDCSEGHAKSASWQDIFKLVSTQSCVVDTNKSLLAVVDEIGTLIRNEKKILLRRDMSLRESRIQGLKLNVFEVLEESSKLKTRLQSRTTRLQQRRSLLDLAKKQVTCAQNSTCRIAQCVSDQRQNLLLLRSNFAPLRVSLITILSNIFPIELSSPPDLLYTILNAPLPIPGGPTDPAPPLMLPEHKEVTEDTVATALGYVAQVLRLISTYTARDLKPELIRDDISAMVGPRMFPLFSVGVDTYRFEYGVFLLNKNIEMLMMERELRALDMRHTLPNLKNLLLTLSHGQGATLRTTHIPDSPKLDLRDTNNRSHLQDPALLQTAEERPTVSDDSDPITSTTPVAGGSGKLRLLGLGPFADFLRSRPLSTRTLTSAPKYYSGTTVQEGHEGNSSLDLDEDQKTIQASPREAADNGDQVMQGSPIQSLNLETS